MDAEMKGYRTGNNDGKERSSGPDWLQYADIISFLHPSRLMASNLTVSLSGCCPFFQIHAF